MKSLQIINTFLLGIIAAMAVLIWHRPSLPAPAGWEYATFHFDGDLTTSLGGSKPYHLMFSFDDWKPAVDAQTGSVILNPSAEGKPEFVAGLSDILDRLSADGWSLVSSDNNNYLVRRPKGKWAHAGFNVVFRQPSDSK